MSSALSTAVSGINNAVARATHSASNIANASLTGKSIDRNLVNIQADTIDVGANAVVIKAVEKEQKALLDITA